MEKLKLTLHPVFIIILFVLIYITSLEHVISYLIALTLHEYSHVLAARALGYSLNNLSIMPYGASLNTSGKTFATKHEVLICLAGPIVNIISVLVMLAVWWIMPITHYYTASFVQASLSLALLNLLPIFPLDFGRVVTVLVTHGKNKKLFVNILKANSYIFSVLFLILFVRSMFYTANPLFIFLSIFMFVSSFDYNNQAFYDYAYLEKSDSDYNKVLKQVTFVVPQNYSYHKLVKLINNNSFINIVFINDKGEAVKQINEKQLIDFLVNHK